MLYLIVILGLFAGYLLTFYKKTKKSGSINWSPLESVVITLSTYFGGQFMGSLLLYMPLLLMGWNQQKVTNWLDSSAFGQFLFILLVEAVSLFLIFAFIRRRGTRLLALGLRKPRYSDIGYALAGFGVYFLIYIAVAVIIKSLVPSLDLEQEQQIGFETAAGAQLSLVFVSLVVLAPLVEEILMRGFLYGGLKKGLPKIWAVVITSALFAVAHLQFGSDAPLLWVAAIDTFVLSLVLIYLRDKTDGLWAPIALHTTKNFVAFLALFVFSAR